MIAKLKRKKLLHIKAITDKEVKLLLKNGVIQNSKYGFIDRSGNPTGYYKTRHKAYIIDKFADMAKSMSE